MKNQWRLLLLRCHSCPSSPNVCRPLSLHRQVSSLLHPGTVYPSPFPSPPTFHIHPRHFSSDPSLSHHLLVIDTFSKPIAGDDIKHELESKEIAITHDLILDVLRNLNSKVDVAVKFFEWVSDRAGERLSSRSYNFMLGILGVNGDVNRFWDLVNVMKKKGYGVHRGAVVKVTQKFEELKLDDDLKRLKELFDYRKAEDSLEAVSSRIVKIIRQEVWSEDVENKIQEGTKFTSDLVWMVLENLQTEPSKALIFFRWVEESGNFSKHDEQTYNAMAAVLGREDCIDRFWNILGEMKEFGYQIHASTYVKVLSRFVKRMMMKDAVDLYEFAMKNGGETNKPSIRDCILLLKKIAVAKEEFDIELFSKTLKIAAESGCVLPPNAAHSMFKSLASVDRLDQFNKVMKAMVSAEVVKPTKTAVAFRLCKMGKESEANEYLQDLDPKSWVSMVEGYCQSGNLKQARECFQKSIEKEGVSSSSSSVTAYALEVLVVAYCNRRMAVEVSNIVSDMVKDRKLKPRHSTYKKLIVELIHHGGFDQALNLLGLMRGHGFPPFLDPFIEFVSKRGKANHAMMFLQAMTSNKYPSTAVFIQVFEGYFKAGRRKEAQNLLALCPGYIQNHPDVLNMFFSAKSTQKVAA